MKTFICSLTMLLGIVAFSFASSLQIVSSDNYVSVEPTADDVKAHCIFKNVSDTTVEVKLIFEPTTIAEGQEVSFCWGPICYPPMDSRFEPKDAMQLAPGEISKDNEFYLTFYPNGNEGKTTVAFTFYVAGNPDDSIHYTVTFESKYLSAEEYENVVNYKPQVFSDKIPVLDFFGKSPPERIQIFNQLGKSMLESSVAPLEIEISSFSRGIYCLVMTYSAGVATKILFLKE